MLQHGYNLKTARCESTCMRLLSCPADRVVATRSKVEGRRVDPEVQLEVMKTFQIWKMTTVAMCGVGDGAVGILSPGLLL